MDTLTHAPLPLEKDRSVPNEMANTPGAEPVKQAMDVARTDTSGNLTGIEKVAYFVASFMMLAPLAMAAWGAHSGL